ncbi:STAS domain-containing protein [Streptomyces zhihengii]|uniref:STAS domain-containing protein n=1 Tax=Streptomyces zhihengii TaxID=1818004 RepID=A0ABS2V3F5_9ACTN|nr:STAS domain-containing protein [Streptomyces zhihengii]MBM9624381.1 STAS domain-containing protein [Streptomyces zhihengii]
MNITTDIHGTSATLTPHGDIDFQHLDQLRATLHRLPPAVTAVAWDLRDAHFVDVAGLHLLNTADAPARATSLTHLHPQPRRLLTIACELFPDADFDRYLPDAGAPHAA